MGVLFDSLKKHFEETPKEILDKEWDEIEHLNEVGIDVIEWYNGVGRFTLTEIDLGMSVAQWLSCVGLKGKTFYILWENIGKYTLRDMLKNCDRNFFLKLFGNDEKSVKEVEKALNNCQLELKQFDYPQECP